MIGQSPLAKPLAYAGMVPFIVLSGLSLVGVDRPLPGVDVIRIGYLYGLVIATFMAGTHWGQATALSRSLPVNLLVTSNIAAVALWLGACFLGRRSEILFLALVFVGLLAIDHRLKRAGLLDDDYFLARVIATTIVVLCLVMLAVHAA